MISLTLLEEAVLDRIIDKYQLPKIQDQLAGITGITREYTVVGVFVDFTLAPAVPSIPKEQIPSNPLSGPALRSPGIHLEGGSILFLKDGKIDCLEMYAHGDYFQKNITDFTLMELRP
jgi:hypothetical protein